MRPAAFLILILTPLWGCEGFIAGADENPAHAGELGPSPEPDNSPSATPAECSGSPQVATAPLRRLSREQYQNTIRDLLGTSDEVTGDFEIDERIGGYESNAVIPISPTSVARYRDAAERLAQQAVTRLSQLLPCDPAAVGEEACVRSFIETFGRRAYRRPLASTELEALAQLYAGRRAKSDSASALGLVIGAVLQSPNFLYRVEQAPGAAPSSVVQLSGLEVATRLAYFAWQAGPDHALLDAAVAGELDTVEGLTGHAERLLADARASAGVRSFTRQWLGLDSLLTLDKNAERFPDFTPDVRRSMFEEGLRFAEEAFRGQTRTVDTLFSGRFTFADAPLARFYGLPEPATPFTRVDLSAENRGGLLTLGAFLTVTSHPSEASPILRGKWIRQNLLCEPLQPPPPGVDIRPPLRDPNVSTKAWLDQHRSDPTCRGCHQLMDPIGFILQHYDAVGRYTDLDGTLPVDATGEIITSGDAAGKYDGAFELSAALGKSSQVRACLAEQLVRYAVGRPKADEDACSIQQAEKDLVAASFDLHSLLLGIVKSDAFRYRKVSP